MAVGPSCSAASDTDLREAAARHLPPAYRALVAATRVPFLQTIQDLSVRRMAVGRIALVGDAAFIARPHTAASTAKAAGNALALVDALKREVEKGDGYSGRSPGLGARPDPIRAASAPPGQAAGRPVADALRGTKTHLIRGASWSPAVA